MSHTEPAVSLHLYSPPFDTCHAFDQRTGHKNKVTMTFHSKFGIKTPFVSTVSLSMRDAVCVALVGLRLLGHLKVQLFLENEASHNLGEMLRRS